MVPTITHDRLLELLAYDPKTGLFRWYVKRRGRGSTSWFSGSIHGAGYRVIGIDLRLYLAHRLAWFYVHGVWPTNELDHKDRNRSNNAIENLREATRSENGRNTSLRSDNTSGAKGVIWSKACGKWLAQIHAEGRGSFIGVFESKEEAIRAYAEEAKKCFGEFHHIARS